MFKMNFLAKIFVSNLIFCFDEPANVQKSSNIYLNVGYYVLAKLESYHPTKFDVQSFIGICKTLRNPILKDHISVY